MWQAAQNDEIGASMTLSVCYDLGSGSVAPVELRCRWAEDERRWLIRGDIDPQHVPTPMAIRRMAEECARWMSLVRGKPWCFELSDHQPGAFWLREYRRGD